MYKLCDVIHTDFDVKIKSAENICKDGKWIAFSSKKELPMYGWKIHVSSIPDDFVDAFKVIYSYCLQHDIFFKIPSTVKDLKRITFGGVPFIQTGKVFTLYIDDSSSLQLHLENLNNLLIEIRGPVIPSDKRYLNSKCLYYRFGSFKSNYFYDGTSGLKHDYYLVNERKVIDIRKPNFYKPNFVEDPVKNNYQDSRDNVFTQKNIRINQVITQKAKGGIYEITYLDKKAIMKEARPFVLYENNLDALDRLENEYSILKMLGEKVDFVPKVYDYFEYMGNFYLVMEYIEGESLEDYIDKQLHHQRLDPDEMLNILSRLEYYLKQLHDLGIIWRDMTPFNIILTDKGIKFIDFEIAYSDVFKSVYTGYTPGFVPVESYMKSRINQEYDYFSLGCICIYLSTGLKAKYDDANTFELIQGIISASIDTIEGKGLKDICMLGIRNINSLGYILKQIPLEYKYNKKGENNLVNKKSFKNHLNKMIDFHYKELVISDNLIELDNSAKNFWPFGLNYGYGGMMYFYMNLLNNNIKVEKSKGILEKLIKENIIFREMEKERNIHPGLYFGEGIFPLILLLSEKYEFSVGSIEPLKDIVNDISNKLENNSSNSISHGRAGLGIVYIKMFELTGDDFYKKKIEHLKNKVVENIEYTDDEDPYWTYYSFDSIQVKKHKFLGFSHGTVGVGYFLCKYYEVNKDQEVLNIILKIINSLYKRKNDINESVFWENRYDIEVDWPHWCNGTTGILQFLNKFIEIVPNNKKAEYLLQKGVKGLISSMKYDTHSYCHGISGHTMTLIDIFKSKHNFLKLDLIHDIENKIINNLNLLDSISLFDSNGFSTWLLEDDKTKSFSLMTGYLGVYLAYIKYHFSLKDILY